MAILSIQQQQHLADLTTEFARLIDAKYKAGAIEHGGFLGDRTPLELVDEAIAECIDQFAFLQTLRAKLCVLKTDSGA